ncbi:hypothetical protein IGI04_042861, partial [Brassica rapa subsp. trilocularis]
MTGRPCVSVSTHRMSVGVRQHTQDVCGCPSVHISALHTGRPWVSASTHKTFVAVCGCPSAHTGRPWLSVYVHVCPCVSVSTHRTSVAVHQYTYQHAGPWTQHAGPFPWDCAGDCLAHVGCLFKFTQGHPWVPARTTGPHTARPWLSISTHISTLVLGLSTLILPVDCSGDFGPRGLSVQYTQDVCGCRPAHTGSPWLSVCVRMCPSAHIGHLWLSISTHISMLVLGLSTLALPVDCLGDFGPCGLSVQYTQDVRGCPPANTGRLWLSMVVRQHTQDIRGCPCVSVSSHRTSVAVHKYTYQHVGPWTQHAGLSRGLFGTHRTSVAVHQYTYQHAGPWTQHAGPWTQHAGPWTQHAGPSRGLFGTHRTSVAVRVCPCVSVSIHRTSVAVHQYTYQHFCPWTQHTDLSRGLFGTQTHPVDWLGDFGPRELSVQYTQDVRGCPPAHTRRSWLSVCVRLCPSAHTRRPWLSICTHTSTLVLRLSTLALPVDCLGDFGPCGLSVQYTQDVCGCPPAHTGRLWVSTSTHMTSVAVRQHTHDVCGCPCVTLFVLQHTQTSVAVHQYTNQHAEHTGHPWVSVSTHSTPDVLGCPSAHTGRLWLSVGVRQHTQDVRGCPCVSVCVRQHSQDVCGCPSAHTGRPWLSVCVRVCPSAHTRRSWLSISTHIRMLVLGLSMLAIPVDYLGDFGPRGLSVQYTHDVHQHTQDVCGCPSAHIGHSWLSVYVHVCSCVSVSTHRTSVAVHQYTYQHAGPWTQHAGPSRGLFGTHRTSVAVRVCPCVSVSTNKTSVAVHQYTYQHFCPWTQHADPSRGLFGTLTHPVDWLADFGPRELSVQYTQDVRGCPSAHTRHSWLSVCVRLCPSAHTGRPWLSICTHTSTLVLRLSTLALPVDCLGDFGPCGLSVQYTQDVCGCPPAHTGRLWVSTSTHMTSVAVRGCPGLSVQITTHGHPWVYVSHYTATTGRLWGPSAQRTSVGCPWVVLCQHTQEVVAVVCVRVCSVSTHRTFVGVHPPQTGRPWTVRVLYVCVPSAPQGRSLAVHQYTYPKLVLGLSTLAIPVDYWGDFGPRGLSVQYTQDVRGCPPAHTRRLWLFVAVRQHTQDVFGCPSRWPFPWTVWVILAHVVCLFSKHRTSVGVRQHTQDVRVCSSAHTGRPWLSMCVRVCPSAHTGRQWLTISTHISHVVPWTQHADPSRGLFSTHRTYVAVHQYTYQHVGPWTQHADPS